jgi:AcrR family transcriptional regulator
VTRSYRSVSREALAEQTRSRIVATAREMLLAEGLSAMKMSELAKAANVSPQTIYNSIGGKADVVKAVWDVTLAGDEEPIPMSERPAFQAVIEATDVDAYARAYASWSRDIYVRVGRLLGMILADGAAGDPEVIGFLNTVDRERRIGNTHGLDTLVQCGAVPSGERLERIIDGVWTLTAPEVYDRLVRQCGWSAHEFEYWLSRQLKAAVTD